MRLQHDKIACKSEKKSEVDSTCESTAETLSRQSPGVAHNAALNVVGQLVPMLVGVFSIPVTIKHIGTERFGIVTIAWMLLGYFSLFDMGLGRALTQLVAEKLGEDKQDDIADIFWTSATLMLLFSLAGALALAAFASPLVHGVLKIPSELRAETVVSLRILAVSIPSVILTAAFIGFISAYQRFDVVNAIRIPMGIFSYAAPLLVLPFSKNLVSIMSALVAGRCVFCLVHFRYSLVIAPLLRKKVGIRRDLLKPLFRFGGWMTVSNIIGPFLVYFDRFLISSLMSVAAVAYYTTPYELVTRLWIIPGALLSVLFPAFAASYVKNSEYAAVLLDRAVRSQMIILFPIVFTIVVWAHWALDLWLGASFAYNSYRVLQWLAVGVFVNSIAQVPFSFIQGVGKPAVTTKLHVGELVVYLPLLWFMVKQHGINGAAIAWLVRVLADCLLLFYCSERIYHPARGVSRATLLAFSFLLLCLLLAMTIPENRFGGVCSLAVLLLSPIVGWKLLLTRTERSSLLARLSSARR